MRAHKTQPFVATSMITQSGEIYKMTWQKPRTCTYGRQFMIIFPDVLYAIAIDAGAPQQSLKVLIWCWARLGFERFTQIRQVQAGVELSLSASTISNCLRYLRARNLIERRGLGCRQEWRLSPEAAWKGTAFSYQRACRDRKNGDEKHLELKPRDNIPP